jgi:hypothetical protein
MPSSIRSIARFCSSVAPDRAHGLYPSSRFVSAPAKQVRGQMMHDSIVHHLGNTMSDSTVYAVLGAVTRALLEITAKVFHLMTL